MGWEAVQPVQAFLPEAVARLHQWLTESGIVGHDPAIFWPEIKELGYIDITS